jgi:hypothetical protein
MWNISLTPLVRQQCNIQSLKYETRPVYPLFEATLVMAPRRLSMGIHYLTTRFFPRSKSTFNSFDHERTTSLHITQLPIEIYLLVLDHVLTSDTLCLILTCKEILAKSSS